MLPGAIDRAVWDLLRITDPSFLHLPQDPRSFLGKPHFPGACLEHHSPTNLCTMFSSLLKFPIWHYLNQPLFETAYIPVLNPRRFWYIYQVEFLERCLDKDSTSSGKLDS